MSYVPLEVPIDDAATYEFPAESARRRICWYCVAVAVCAVDQTIEPAAAYFVTRSSARPALVPESTRAESSVASIATAYAESLTAAVARIVDQMVSPDVPNRATSGCLT